MAGVSAGLSAFFFVSPAGVKPESYALLRGQVEGRLNAEYYSAEVRGIVELLQSRFPNIKPLGAYGEVVCGPFGTAVKHSDYVTDGVPLLRISNITGEGTLDFQDIVFITQKKSDTLGSTQVVEGDIVISQRGTLGMSALVSSEYPVFNISANLIAMRSITGLDPRFIQLYLTSAPGALQIKRLQSGQVHPKITTDDVASVLIPNVASQNELIHRMDIARHERTAKLIQADALMSRLDNFVLDTLGIAPSPEYSRQVFAVRRGNVSKNQLDPSRYAPELQTFLSRLRSHPAASQPLEAYVDINPPVDVADVGRHEAVGFIPMGAVADRATGDYTFEERSCDEVRKGYTSFADGDILWAKITPCMQNGKSCIAEGLPNGIGFGSTEFHVLRVRDQGVSKEFVKEFVSQKRLREAATYAFTGSAGQQRVPAEFLSALPFPRLAEAEQREIVDEVASTRARVGRLRTEAEVGWQEAKRWFEKRLLGTVEP